MGVRKILTEGWNWREAPSYQKFQTYYPKNVLQSYIRRNIVWLQTLS